uniref:Uncharacterized protein n=1 Tax=Daphnia galeata TaxID=27404 RepID=A0A8J2RMG2_9CRUS|nr:unnamed protein product [Daphnia galeata]
MEITYICRSLKFENVLVVGEDKYPKVHQSCGHKHFKNKSSDCIIIEMPIEKQLKYFLEHHGLPSDTNNQQEINADGAKYFKTSKYSFSPLMAIVNEASYKIR